MTAVEGVVGVGDIINIDSVITFGSGKVPDPARLAGVSFPGIFELCSCYFGFSQRNARPSVKNVRTPVSIHEIEAGAAIQLVVGGGP